MLTLNQLSEMFFRYQESLVKTGSISQLTADWHRRGIAPLLSPLGFKPACEIRTLHIAETRYTPHTVRCVTCLYNWAVKNDLVPKNPFIGAPKQKYGERTRTLTDIEFRQIRRNISRTHRWLLWFMNRTCARPGELRRAKWSDVHWQTSTIILNQFKAKERRRDKIRSRCLYIDPNALRVLSFLQRSRNAGPDDFLFPGPGGREIRKDALSLEFRRTVKRLKLNIGWKEKLVPYSVRHTAATAAAASGVQLRDLAEIMGHTTIQMTMRYLHPSQDQLRAAIALANKKKPRLRLVS